MDAFETRRVKLDLVDLLFIFSAFVAPLEIKLFASFTAYDLIIMVCAGLILAGPRRLRLLGAPFAQITYVFLLAALVSTFRSTHPIESLTQIVQFAFIFYVQLPVIVTLMSSRRVLNATLLLFFCGALVGAGWAAIFQHVQGAGRTLVFYSDNPNRLGYPTAYLLPFALHYVLEQARKRQLLLLVLVTLPVLYLLLWALAASGSRSATVGTVTALLVFFTFRKGLHIDWRVPVRLTLALAAIGIIGYAFYNSPYLPDTLRTRVDGTLAAESSLVDDRRRLAEAGLMAFEESPLIGVGFDNMRYVTKDYVPAATEQVPHNIWIQYLSQTGIFGTLAFLGLMLLWFLLMLRSQQRLQSQSLREVMWALIASMVAIMTIFLFLPIMDQRQYWLLYGIGLAVALDILADEQISTLKSAGPALAMSAGQWQRAVTPVRIMQKDN
jgi:O-antigen ligase